MFQALTGVWVEEEAEEESAVGGAVEKACWKTSWAYVCEDDDDAVDDDEISKSGEAKTGRITSSETERKESKTCMRGS